MECGDTLAPLVKQILDDIVQKCISAGQHGISVQNLIPTLLGDYEFLDGDIRKIEILKLNEVSRR